MMPPQAHPDEMTAAQVREVVEAAAAATYALEGAGRTGRATLLRSIGDGLEARREEIIELGMRETHLGEPRLNGELRRTAYQARLFADVIDEGGYVEATVDHEAETPMGPGPDLRRMLVPLGPVGVFGANNFPLAFSVPGGDTVSALAAGCPVVVKAHPSHPGLSGLTFNVLARAAESSGLPVGTVGLVSGRQAGLNLVEHPAIRAVAFTGSLAGGRTLMDAAAARPEPIPFYGEMSSLNPVVISEEAAEARGEQLADQLVASVTGSGGQLCTKPGLVFLPSSSAGTALADEVVRRIGQVAPQQLLDNRVAALLDEELSATLTNSAFESVSGPEAPGRAAARVLMIHANDLDPTTVSELFGPVTIVVRGSLAQITNAAGRLPASLTASVHVEDADLADYAPLIEVFRVRSGRVLFNSWPTGVHVSWAQNHGGPWPATNTLHTSVGTASIRRFLRPLTWQNAPAVLLPEELRDDFKGIPRRVDGVLHS